MALASLGHAAAPEAVAILGRPAEWQIVELACSAVAHHADAILMELVPASVDTLPLVREALGDPRDLTVRCADDGSGDRGAVLSLAPGADIGLIETVLASSGAWRASGAPPPLQSLSAQRLRTAGDVVRALLDGKLVAVGSAGGSGYSLSRGAWPRRPIGEAPNEKVLQGPHAGFSEELGTNVALVRQFVRSPALRWERVTFPQAAGATVALVYLDDAVRPGLVATLRSRLREFDPGRSVTGTVSLQEWLNGWRGRVLPLVDMTERPDKVARSLQEGRAAVLVDGSPVAILAPAVFVGFLEMTGDYLVMPWVATLLRGLRLTSLLLACSASAAFVAVSTVNVNVLPYGLFNSISQARQGVPFPTVAEVLIMEVLVEVMREASVLMPGPLGQSISVLGAIILGQSAVAAGIVSAPVIVVVALGYIASLVIPSYDLAYAVRLARFGLIGLGAFLGLNGVSWGLALGLVGLASLRSFGTPYLSPVSPLQRTGIADAVLRRPFTGRQRSIWQLPHPGA